MAHTGQTVTTEQLAENHLFALQAIRAWLDGPAAQTGFHVACPYKTGASMIVRQLIQDLGPDRLVVAVPTGREAAHAQETYGVTAQTLHRLVYTTRKEQGETRFVPRGDGPLWSPETQLVVALSAQRMKARDVAHLLTPGKRVLLLADPYDAMIPKDAFLAERTPDHTVAGPQMRQSPRAAEQAFSRLHRTGEPRPTIIEAVGPVPAGRVMDALESWLDAGPAGSWLRINPDDHDGRIGTLAAATARRLPDAELLGTTDTLSEADAFSAALGRKTGTVSDAQRATQAGRPLLVLSDSGTLMKPESLAKRAEQAPVIHVTRSGPTGPVRLVGTAPDARHTGLVTLTRQEVGDGLAVESENGTPLRIVATRNNYETGVMHGEVFTRMPGA